MTIKRNIGSRNWTMIFLFFVSINQVFAQNLDIDLLDKINSSATTNGVLIRGYVRSSTYTATTGQILYVSQTAGSITATPPSTSGKVVRILGYHIDTNTDTMYFDPSKDWLEL